MTPKQRAEKILDLCWQRIEERKPQSAKKIIVAQIREAEAGAFKQGRDFEHKNDEPLNGKCCNACFLSGRASAFEEAAKEADKRAGTWSVTMAAHAEEITKAIRALARESR